MFWWRKEVESGVSVAFTDVAAGNLALHVGEDAAEVRSRRARLEQEIGLGDQDLRFMHQVHGNDVAVRVPGDRRTAPAADAMVSLGLPLAVMVADCVPVVLVAAAPDSADEPMFGVVHAGRPGVANGVVPAAIEAMRRQGARSVRAWIGPSICGACYEVPEQMRADVAAIEPCSSTATRWGTPGLDLPTAVLRQLERFGVEAELVGGCTLENEELFSYRRDRATGRFVGMVWAHG